MSNNLNTFVKVNVLGEDLYLKFDFNAVCELEEIYNKGIAGILREEQMGFKLVRTFYYVGLKWKYKNVTPEAVGKKLGDDIQENGTSIADLFKPVMDALKKSRLIGSPKAGEEEKMQEEAFKTEDDEEAAEEFGGTDEKKF
jgi:hypothetical protein